ENLPKRLKSQFQRELERPGAALLKERTQTCHSSHSQPLTQHCLGLVLRRAVLYVRRRVCEVRMIQEIESIRPKLKIQSFRDRKFPRDRTIHLRQPESGNVVSSF